MVDFCISLFTNVFNSVTSWFSSVFTKTGMASFFLTFFVIYTISRLLVSPIFGRGSDKASSKTSKQEDNSDE